VNKDEEAQKLKIAKEKADEYDAKIKTE